MEKMYIYRLIKKSGLLIIIIIWGLFSVQYFLNDTAPFPSQYQVNFFPPWSTYSELAGPVKNNAMPDIIGQIYPWKKFTIDSLMQGNIPLWNPYSFAGTPHLANYQSATLTPFNILFFFLPFKEAWRLLILLQPLLAGIFMYLFVRGLKISGTGAVISGVSFMFCGFITAWMAYGTLGYAILFLPLALYSVEKFYKSKRSIFLVILALCIPLSFFSGHFQVSLYFLGALILYLIFKWISNRDKNLFIHSSLAIGAGLLLSMPQILPTLEFYNLSTRIDIVQKLEVIPWRYVPTLVAPDFFGNPVTRNDWFGHYAEWNGYAGLIALILASYAFFRKKKKEVLYFSALIIGSILMAFDTPVLDLVVNLKIPVLSTSAASRIIVLFSFSVAVLAGFGFDELKDIIDRKSFKKIIIPILLWGFIFAILWGVVLSGIMNGNGSVAKSNLILSSALLIGFTGVIVTKFVYSKYFSRYKEIILIGLLILLSFEMLRFVNKWMPQDPMSLVFKDVPTTEFYKSLDTNQRVIGNFGAENSVYYRLQVLDGYDPLYINRYGEFIAYLTEGKPSKSQRSVVNFPKIGKHTDKALEFLGIGYVIHKFSDGRAPWAYPFWQNPEQFELVYDDSKYEVYKNKDALPRAFIVNGYKIRTNDEDILSTIFNDDTNLRDTVILEKNPGIETIESNLANAKILNYKDNSIEILVESERNALLVLSDNYYPGWRATVNGKDTEIFRANYTFRAIIIPKGNSTVKFIYEPDSYRYGRYMFLLGLVIIIGSYIYLKKYGFKN